MKILRVLKNKSSVAFMSMMALMSVGTSAFAADAPVIDTAQIDSTFSSITTTVLVIIGTVAVSAVVVMGAFMGWKYGRKLYGMIAK